METSWWAVALSGFGVAVAGWIGNFIYRHLKKDQDNSTQNIISSMVTGPVAGRDMNIEQLHISSPSSILSVGEEQYRERPTPQEMKAEIGKVSMYAQQSVAETFSGLKIRWTGSLSGIRVIREDKTEVDFRIDDTYVVT